MKLSLIIFAIAVSPTLKPQNTVIGRFKAPAHYERVQAVKGSFGYWLQHLSLKPAGTHAHTYNGSVARTDAYTAAVIDLSVGRFNLQQCADAVIRLRAEYLYQKKDYKSISFHFTSGFSCDFVHYADGYRYHPDGRWIRQGKKDYSYANFLNYLNLVFSYAGTKSLEKELKPVTDAANPQIGDVFIKGGSPGHCFIIMDVIKASNGQKKFLLAQSFMPAQDIQILHQNGFPWFSLNEIAYIPYGQLVNAVYLKRF